MKICLETSSLRPPLTGVGTYTLSLARALASDPHGMEFFEFDGNTTRPLTLGGLDLRNEPVSGAGGLVRKGAGLVRRSQQVRRLWRWYKGRRYAQTTRGLDLFHALNFVAPRATTAPVLPMIYDLSFVRMPEAHPSERVQFLTQGLERLHDCPWVNALSEFSADEVADYYSYPRDRIGVTYPGIGQRYYEAPSAESVAAVRALGVEPGGFFLSVGTLEPRKNHRILVEAYSGLPKSFRQRFPLLIAGASGWGDLALKGLDVLVQEGAVRFVGYLPEDTVHALYHQARALLFPSVYEGFGLPVAEAMAGGTQPIVSDIPVMHEVAGEMGLYAPPRDADGWRDAILSVAETEPDRERLIARARRFTWEKTARDTIALYRRF